MFTGLVQAVSRVKELGGFQLQIEKPQVSDWEPFRLGESLAVNGCCLTVIERGDVLSFDLSEETLSRTTLGSLRSGDLVNLERAMRPTDRFGGHFVQGHVDTVGEIVSIEPREASTYIRFRVAEDFAELLVDKGSIAVDGISLTIVGPHDGTFAVAIIPHTLEHTNLSTRKTGDRVNIEFDMLAKHVHRMFKAHQPRQ